MCPNCRALRDALISCLPIVEEEARRSQYESDRRNLDILTRIVRDARTALERTWIAAQEEE